VPALSQLRRLEDGLTLVELLVATVLIGALAAIALPTFRGQGDKGSDAEAKAAAVEAAKAIESCAADHGGRYSECPKETLITIQPSLADAQDRFALAATASTYRIVVTSKRGPEVAFTMARAADGTTSRTCTTDGERGGCQVPTSGTW
jgi:prepilin-type N-terminal cleavage/methylation domain-containing protein